MEKSAVDSPTPHTPDSGSRTKPDTEALPVQPEKEQDPDLVDWDGLDDPENPFNWPSWKKWRQLIFMAINTFLTPLASTMFTPGVADILQEFGSDSTMMASFLASIYILGYVVGPFIIAPLSELYGRVPLYHICNILLLIFTIACAAAQSLPQLLVFRLLAGIAGVCPLTIGGGTVADMVCKEKRAGMMAIWTLGPYMGPVVGPIVGGYLVMAEGWRWVFWVLSITIGLTFTGTVICYRETYAPVLLHRKAQRLRKETGNPRLRSIYDDGNRSPRYVFITALLRPTRLLFTSPIVFLMALFAAITYGYLYLMFTTMSSIFEDQYGFNQGIAGLAYIGFGVGCALGLLIVGRTANAIAVRHSAQGRFAPESRLPPMIYGCWAIPVGLFWYGWSAEEKVHWIMPIIGTGIFGFGFVAVFATVSVYLVDSYLRFSASVTAANVFLRSLLAAVLPLAGPSMYDALGLGWGNSLLAFVALAMCFVPLLFAKYGAMIRTHPKFQLQLE
ncbi:major facilitator superfamily domain-containing protein [Aspergillus caelatus]|uniref:Major facilitator superfamily domain-containing protein n=1 Tax=Aspergillus caelatus TaxID=61420 RepID=A0A5N6ZX32_9EURO|nr:major facilitator superfamily domain-containing protein [Aspergillus caelatus]KAE8361496.1 major facilitator superfamily domain-containing protein [Aspergillus caelatus]